MSDKEKFTIAKEYVDKQLSIMKGFDAAPKVISPSEYKSLIERVAETIQPQPKKARSAAR